MKPVHLAKKVINKLGFELRRLQPTKASSESAQQTYFRGIVELRDLSIRIAAPEEEWRFLKFCEAHMMESRSQLLQDLFVLFLLDGKKNGFFVEFGATDGISINNTYTLEKQYGWTGIVAEPARCWREQIKIHRNCSVDLRCVWDKTGEALVFKEVAAVPELSTISIYADSDHHQFVRMETGADYLVETVSMMDLLAQHQAPRIIDYLSIDTEGTELKILQKFDFDAYNIRIITVEHNHTTNRARIYELLTLNGYRRRFQEFSAWDDWYVRE